MKKKFKLNNLDCANCAAKMESKIQQIDGVSEAAVSFLSQRLTIEGEDARFDEIMKDVAKTIRKIEPDCEIIM